MRVDHFFRAVIVGVFLSASTAGAENLPEATGEPVPAAPETGAEAASAAPGEASPASDEAIAGDIPGQPAPAEEIPEKKPDVSAPHRFDAEQGKGYLLVSLVDVLRGMANPNKGGVLLVLARVDPATGERERFKSVPPASLKAFGKSLLTGFTDGLSGMSYARRHVVLVPLDPGAYDINGWSFNFNCSSMGCAWAGADEPEEGGFEIEAGRITCVGEYRFDFRQDWMRPVGERRDSCAEDVARLRAARPKLEFSEESVVNAGKVRPLGVARAQGHR